MLGDPLSIIVNCKVQTSKAPPEIQAHDYRLFTSAASSQRYCQKEVRVRLSGRQRGKCRNGRCRRPIFPLARSITAVRIRKGSE